MTAYTKVPNGVFEKLWNIDINFTEFKILTFVIRYTLGFNRFSADISSGFLSKGLNIDKKSVQRTVNGLIQKGLIKEYKKATCTTPRKIGLSDCFLNEAGGIFEDRGVGVNEDRGMGVNEDRGVGVFVPQENKYINKTINKTNKAYPEKNWSGCNKENTNCTFDPEEFFLAAVEKSRRS